MKLAPNLRLSIFAIDVTVTLTPPPASAQQIEGQILGAGAPIANARVTLFAAPSERPLNSPRLKAVLTVTSRCLPPVCQAARLFCISPPLVVNQPRIGAAEITRTSRS